MICTLESSPPNTNSSKQVFEHYIIGEYPECLVKINKNGPIPQGQLSFLKAGSELKKDENTM